MRVVLDTNIVASALLWGGTPERLIELAGEGSLECFTSEALLAELTGILDRASLSPERVTSTEQVTEAGTLLA